MPINNRIADLAGEIALWRQDIHAHPEILFEVQRTAQIVADRLASFGCDEVVTGIARTGVVGVIRGRSNHSGRVVGLRADMDALPITEISDLPYKSTVEGAAHACGHDGHTAMLLGAARYLTETRNFDGTVVVIFQPAEEGGGGGRIMVEEGMMDRFEIDEVYGMHNMPGMPVGTFGLRPGPMMAAADRFEILIEGRGGHAAKPHQTIDPVVIASEIVMALQSIVSRGTDPVDSCVVSVTQFHAGTADNIIPQTAQLRGTVRTLKAKTRDFAEARLSEVVEGIAALHRAKATVQFRRGYPVLENHDEPTHYAAAVAGAVVGEDNVTENLPPTLGGEDFSYMLQARPGAFIFVGNGNSSGLHHPSYNFDDAVIPVGVSYWAKLVEHRLPAS